MPTQNEYLVVGSSALREKAEQLEDYIETLMRQRNALQSIERWTRDYDFADFIETVQLLELHIDMNQRELRGVKMELAGGAGSSFSSLRGCRE